MEGNSRARTGIVCLQSLDHILMSKKEKRLGGTKKNVLETERGTLALPDQSKHTAVGIVIANNTA